MNLINFIAPIEEESSKPIYLGLLICILGNTLISFALNLQKYVHNKLKSQLIYQNLDSPSDTEPTQKLNYLKQKLWWLAQFLMIFGEGGNFLAYGFAPASLIAPLGTVSLISNAIIAPFLLGEMFRIRDACGIFLSILGAVIVVAVNGGSESDEIPPEEFFNLFLKTKVLIYVIVCAILVFILNKLSKKWGHKIIFIDLGIVGIFGSFTVLSTKGVSVQLSQLGWKFINYPSNFILIVVLVLTGMVQIKYLNQSLHHFTSTQVVPTQFVSFTLNVIIGSGIVYDDFAKFTIWQTITFSFGCSLTFLGVYLISSMRPSETLPQSPSSSSYISQVETNTFPNSSSSSIIINISNIGQSIQQTPISSYSLNETSNLQTLHSHASPGSKSHLFYSQASSPNNNIKFTNDYRTSKKSNFNNYGSTP